MEKQCVRGKNKGLEEQLKKGAIDERLYRRKKRLNETLLKKRLSTHPNELTPAKGAKVQEEKIEEQQKKEEACDIGLPVLTKHRKKSSKPRKSKKRCWVCKQPGHLKRKCPYIRCFYCHRLGHIKADCRDKKMDYIMNQVVKAKKKKERNKKRKEKQKTKQKAITEIYKKRLQQTEFKFKNGEYELLWKEQPIGKFNALGLPEPLDKFRRGNIPWHKVDVIVRTPTPTKNLKLIEGMLNYCGCGEIDLPRGNFILHTNGKHNGYAPPNSRINQPHWIYGILYNDDETEMLYCRTQADLS